MNGSTSASSDAMSAAQRLQEKHQANATHHVMVEETVDEEDIQHPPPSMQAVPPSSPDAVPPQVAATDLTSEKAAGKRKAEPQPTSATTVTNGENKLNMLSEEAFPALGGGPKASAPPPSTAWGAKRHTGTPIATNGINGHPKGSSMVSSRASTPTSGIATPSSTTTSTVPPPHVVSYPQHMPLPGRHQERIQFAPSQLLPRGQLKKPLPEILRSINKTSKANLEMKTGANGNIIFEGSGPVDAARQALKDLAREVGSKVCTTPYQQLQYC